MERIYYTLPRNSLAFLIMFLNIIYTVHKLQRKAEYDPSRILKRLIPNYMRISIASDDEDTILKYV